MLQERGFIQDKRAIDLLGGEIILWFFRFFLLIVIIAGIALIAYSFYSKNIDTREIEIGLISGKIADCIAKDGILQDVSFLNPEKCGLNFNLEENYINITSQGKSSFIGNSNFEVLCRLRGISMQYKPACLAQKYYVLNQAKEGVYVDLLVATIKGVK